MIDHCEAERHTPPGGLRGCLAVLSAASLLILGCEIAEPRKFNSVHVSWGDHIVVFSGSARLDTESKIADAMRCWRDDFNIRHIYWRVSHKIIREYMKRAGTSASEYFDAVNEIEARLDCAAAAVRQAHANGLKIFMYLTIFDMGSPPTVLYGGKTPFPWQSRFVAEHPEFQVVDRAGKRYQYGVCEYAYPEVRKYKLDQIARLFEQYDFDGVYICTRSHSEPADHADQFGYNEPIVREFKRRYGVDIRKDDFDKEKWRRLRGEYLVKFFRELRERFPRKLIAAAIPRGDRIGPPYGNMYLDWRTMVRERLVDELVVGVYSGKWLYPNKKGSDAAKGYLCSDEENLGVLPINEEIEKNYGPECSKAGVRLFIHRSTYDKKDKRLIAASKYLTGYMLNSAALTMRSNYLEVPDHPSLAFSDGVMTVDFRIKCRSFRKGKAGRVVSKYDHTLPGGTGRGWEIYIDDQGRIVFRLGSETGEQRVRSETRLRPGEWTHVACVSEGAPGKMLIFVNGKLDPAVGKAPAGVRKVPVDLMIGRYGGSPSCILDGDLDEIRISNTARGFAAPPSAPYEGREAGTVALYHCDRIVKGKIRNAACNVALIAVVHGPQEDLIVPGGEGFGGALAIRTDR